MKNRHSLITKLLIAGLCISLVGTAFMSGCSDDDNDEKTDKKTVSEEISDVQTSDEPLVPAAQSYSIEFGDEDKNTEYDASKASAVKLNDTTAELSGNGVSFSEKTLNITSAGTFVISGKLSDGQIKIKAGKNDIVKLVLDNASVSSSETSALYVEQCKKTIIVLKENTVNSFSDGKDYVTDDGPDAAVYVQDDLSITGSGTLNVTGNAKNGITSKDVLRISGSVINVTAANHGITGKDDLAVENSTITVDSKDGDGLRSTYSDTDKAEKGHVTVTGSDITVTCANDAIQAEKTLTINSGNISIVTGGGSDKVPKKNYGFGDIRMTSGSSDGTTEESSDSRKGLKSGGDLVINGGTINIDSYDDAIHSNSSAAIKGGKLEIRSGDDAVHADAVLDITDGEITVSKSYEGLEAIQVHITGGNIDITASDDGINAAGGNDNSGFGNFDGKMDFGGRRRNRMSETSADNKQLTTSSSANTVGTETLSTEIVISGGTVCVNSGGDGIDSNSALKISGGTIILNGPVTGGNGIIDHDGDCSVTGGLLIGAGTSDMLEMPGNESTQKTVAITLSERQKAGSLIYVTDSSGKAIAAMKPEVDYGCLILISADLTDGDYTVYLGGSASGESVHGYLKNASASDGSKFSEFTVSDTVTYVDQNGNTQGSGGFGGRGQGGQRPDQFRPDNLPSDFDPDKMPDNFRPDDIPSDFDPNKMPDNFRPDNLPSDFDPNKMPDGNRPGGMGGFERPDRDNGQENSTDNEVKTI